MPSCVPCDHLLQGVLQLYSFQSFVLCAASDNAAVQKAMEDLEDKAAAAEDKAQKAEKLVAQLQRQMRNHQAATAREPAAATAREKRSHGHGARNTKENAPPVSLPEAGKHLAYSPTNCSTLAYIEKAFVLMAECYELLVITASTSQLLETLSSHQIAGKAFC